MSQLEDQESDSTAPNTNNSNTSTTSSSVTGSSHFHQNQNNLPPFNSNLQRTNHPLPPPPLSSLPPPNSPAAAALHPGLRRLILLQTLAARQQAALQLELQHGNPHHPPPTSSSSSSAPEQAFNLPSPTAPPPTPLHSPHALSPHSPILPNLSTSNNQVDMPWTSVIEGLNAISPSSSTPGSGASSGESGHGISNPPENVVTQEELDWWRNMAFSSPHAASEVPRPSEIGYATTSNSLLATPAFPLPSATPSTSGTHPLPPIHPNYSHDHIDWSSFFPIVQVAGQPVDPSHRPQPLPSGLPMAKEHSGEEPSISPSGSGRAGKARAKSVSKMDEGSGEDPANETSLDPEEVEEDKRRRNTAASARFRAKKKQRDAELQQTSVQLRDKVSDLERQSQSLRSENKYLRDLISEKAEMDPRLLDVLRAHPGAGIQGRPR